MRLRNVIRAQKISRAHETSGLSGTESTMLATPILNGRKAVRTGSNAGEKDNGRHLFINYPASAEPSPQMQRRVQQDGLKTLDVNDRSPSNCSLYDVRNTTLLR